MTSFDLWSALPGCGQEEADHGHCTNSMQLPLYRAAPQSDLTHLCFLSHAIIIYATQLIVLYYNNITVYLYSSVFLHCTCSSLWLNPDHLPHPVYTRLSLVL